MQTMCTTMQSFYNCCAYSLYKKDHYKSMSAEAIKTLMEWHKKGALDLVIDKRETVLDCVIEANNVEVVKYLCSTLKKQQLNYKSKTKESNFNTPINTCLSIKDGLNRNGELEVLLKNGADPNKTQTAIKDSRCISIDSPLGIAKSNANPQAFALLLDHGANFPDSYVSIDDIVKNLWDVYKTNFNALSADKSLPQELIKLIKYDFVSKIVHS